MVKKENYIKEIIKEFYDHIKGKYTVKKILLYGSYAKGNYSDDSDIDIAVVVDEDVNEKRLQINSDLFKIASGIDVKIEPRCILWKDYLNHEPASITAEIIRTGQTIC